MSLNFSPLSTFPLAKTYCFEATYLGIVVPNNFDNLSPSCKVPALIDTFELGEVVKIRERDVRFQSRQLKEGR